MGLLRCSEIPLTVESQVVSNSIGARSSRRFVPILAAAGGPGRAAFGELI